MNKALIEAQQSNWYKDYPQGEEWLADIRKEYDPRKVHWCMDIDTWKKGLITRVQCKSRTTKYMLSYEDYNIPQKYKCKHCHKQWLKMRNVINNFSSYKFYRIMGKRVFVPKIRMVGFSNFSVDLLYFQNEFQFV